MRGGAGGIGGSLTPRLGLGEIGGGSRQPAEEAESVEAVAARFTAIGAHEDLGQNIALAPAHGHGAAHIGAGTVRALAGLLGQGHYDLIIS